MTNLSGLLLPLLLLLLVGFMFWSQRRRQRAVVDLQSALEVGDEVCTTSGLFGVITALDETVAHLEVAPGTIVRFDRRAVALAVTSGPPTGTSGTTGMSSTGITGATQAAPYDAPERPTSPTSPTDEK